MPYTKSFFALFAPTKKAVNTIFKILGLTWKENFNSGFLTVKHVRLLANMLIIHGHWKHYVMLIEIWWF